MPYPPGLVLAALLIVGAVYGAKAVVHEVGKGLHKTCNIVTFGKKCK